MKKYKRYVLIIIVIFTQNNTWSASEIVKNNLETEMIDENPNMDLMDENFDLEEEVMNAHVAYDENIQRTEENISLLVTENEFIKSVELLVDGPVVTVDVVLKGKGLFSETDSRIYTYITFAGQNVSSLMNVDFDVPKGLSGKGGPQKFENGDLGYYSTWGQKFDEISISLQFFVWENLDSVITIQCTENYESNVIEEEKKVVNVTQKDIDSFDVKSPLQLEWITYFFNDDLTLNYSEEAGRICESEKGCEFTGRVEKITKYFGKSYPNTFYAESKREIFILNENQQIVESKLYEKGEYIALEEKKYFENAFFNKSHKNKVKEKIVYKSGGYKPYKVVIYEDETGKIKKITHYTDGDYGGRTQEYYLNNNGDLEKCIYYNWGQSDINKVLEYSAGVKYGQHAGKQSKEYYFNNDGTLKQVNKSEKNILKSVTKFYSGAEYGEHANRVSMIFYLNEDKTVKQVNKYVDNSNNVREILKYYKGAKYGEHQKKVKTTIYFNKDKTVRQANKYKENTSELTSVITFYKTIKYGEHGSGIEYCYYLRPDKTIKYAEQMEQGTGKVLKKFEFESHTLYGSKGEHWNYVKI